MNDSWIVALGLVLVLEGGIPFLFPRRWRDVVDRIARLSDGQIRFLGLAILLCGLATLISVRLF